MVFLLWEEGSVWQDKGSGVAINALGVCKMAASFKFGVTLKAFRGVKRAVIVVESPVLVGKLTSG